MKPLAIRKTEAKAASLEGRVACHDVRDGAGKVAIAKGQTLDAAATSRLLGLDWQEVHVLEL
ncbi:MAG TPA: hypothetical protein VFO18_15915, partial [Methylomirabilota bacterium]|nr:hypothetical protein [Methylomirabilota bacterium]